jgi:hypothetical protein
MHSINTMFKKILIPLSVLAIIATVIIFAVINQKSVINIYTVPDDATISIDNKEVGKGHVSLGVTRGKHQVQAVRDGYNTYSESLSVTKDTTQTIALTPTQTLLQEVNTVNVTPYAASSFQLVTPDTLIAIDSNNSNLIKIDKNGITTLYTKPVYAFSFVKPYVALIEKGDRGKIAVINIEKGSTKIFDATKEAPVVSISISGDAKNLYFLGNYNPANRSCSLFVNSLDTYSPTNKGVLAADGVSALNNGRLLLTFSADAADASVFAVYDVSSGKYLYRTSGSGAIISPSFKNLAIYSSTSLRGVSLESFAESPFDYSLEKQKVAWLDSDILVVLTNKFPGVEYRKINVTTDTQTSNTPINKFGNMSVRSALGIIGNTLYLQDSEGKIWSIRLP